HILIRGAFSSNIKERRDCSTGIFDAAGRLVAQADHMPIHIGSLLWGVRAVLERYGVGEIADGDAFVMNDPYLAGGTHLPDISVITPVFVDGELRFFVGNIAHHADVGGPAPGSVSGTSPNIFHEGIRLPPIRIARGGVADEDVIDLIAHNTREPLERQVDLKTQVGANLRGAALLRAVVDDYDLATVERAIEDIIAYTRRRISTVLGSLPDGTYTAVRHLDDDGGGAGPVPLCVAATVDGTHLTLDFAGSGPEARGAVNLSASSLEATVAYCLKALLDPGVPANSGLVDAVEIRLPGASIVNPRSPAAVAARAVTSNRLAGAIFEAISQALPTAQRMASSNDSTSLIVMAGADPDRGGSYVYPESIGGGAGAAASLDGMDAVHVHTVNSTNLPVEMLESAYPLRCTSYALVPDSGGSGRRRGGLGIQREVEALVDGTTLTVRSDGHLNPAPGAEGGGAGSVTRVTHIDTQGAETELGSKSQKLLNAGERVRVETLGGGGFGAPQDRPLAALRADLLDGELTRAVAESAYGSDREAAALQVRD
ncbi:MAG: hydantoinase B/oxoprolinase family protein, partial [Pseudomonadota bacterium]